MRKDEKKETAGAELAFCGGADHPIDPWEISGLKGLVAWIP